MSRRIEQVNEVLRSEIALAAARDLDLPGMLITVTKVDCARKLDSAKVWVSVLPDNKAGSALRGLRKQQGLIRQAMAKKILWRKLPRLIFLFDDTEKQAAKLEDIFKEINLHTCP
ncbi:ribosome-binding factor A [Candidatus Falkowbacteria bacterium CG10_big_fil_rev_8_21_14_0_10_43_11]|uniref:Ribosome-binding factor A n=1 Tax=Candidatus Falkowbacteria bacterium CG10_big_fil_rev_8_21_14_0_10_43_11 TaxID=1974568 RepID=A0A2M6WMS2_9BACT|nr:MAG: ribosome-binding factor A [Candidatus Falkowbacteria bacterium CG10_big_fil_rev_8_21_14_0_10_43_11]